MTTALLSGAGAGLAVAVQVGAVSLLVVETAMRGGSRAGVAAGMGVATADLGFATVAAAAGGAATAVLAGHENEIRLCAAAFLAAVAVHGLARLRSAPAADGAGIPPAASVYRRFLAITAVNPLTIASFAAIAASLSLEGAAAAAAFALGAGARLRRLAPPASARGRARGRVDHATPATGPRRGGPARGAGHRRQPRAFCSELITRSVTVRTSLARSPLLLAVVALIALGVAAEPAAAALKARGSINQAYVLGAKKGQKLKLVRHGRVIDSGQRRSLRQQDLP